MTSGAVIILGQGVPHPAGMNASDYQTEDAMQNDLASYPDLLPGDQINEANPRRWLLVKREMGVPDAKAAQDRWSLDHLFLDQDGIPTFVECKRAVNTQVRREVIAQMLDYAANGLAYWRIDHIKQEAASTVKSQNQTLDQAIRTLLHPDAETSVETFWTNVESNLRAGKVRLIFVAERIPKELMRLVVFLNERFAAIDVLAVEIKQFNVNGQRILAPCVVGITPESDAIKQEAHMPKLNSETLLTQSSPGGAEILAALLAGAAQRNLPVAWHTKCFSIKVPIEGRDTGVVYAYPDRVEVYFGNVVLPEAEQQELRDDLLRLYSPWIVTDKMLKVMVASANIAQPEQFSVALLDRLKAFGQRHPSPTTALE